MMRRLLIFVFLLTGVAYGQNWNGVLSPNRATDWTQAGIPGFSINGSLPSDTWTQCGSTIAAFGSSGSPSSPTAITTAMSGCAANHYVLLGVGDFWLNAGMCMKLNNVELRGSGPTQTRLHFNSSITCQGGGAQVNVGFANANGDSTCCGTTSAVGVTAGLSQGSTSITVANAATLGIIPNSTMLILDQCDTGYSGSTTGGAYANTCASGTSVDNGNFYSAGAAYVPSAHSGGTCTVSGTGITGTGFSASFGGIINLTISGVTTSVPFTFSSSTSGTIGQKVTSSGTLTAVANGSYACSFPTGNSYNDPNGKVGRNHRFQEEMFLVSACSPSCSNAGSTVLTITSPLIHPNWVSGQSPEVWPVQAFKNVGIRNLRIDATGSGSNPGLDFNNVVDYWSRNVIINNTASQGIGSYESSYGDISSNYIYNAGSSVQGSDPNPADASGIDINGSHNLVANNIIQWSRIAIIPNGPAAGNVIAYNYAVNCFESNGDMWGCLYDGHQNGTDYNLWESNQATQAYQDQTHGGKLAETWYRNFVTGWQSCANGQCSPNATAVNANVFAMAVTSSNRYDNIVGNVFGTPGVTSVYNFTQPDQFSGTSTGYIYDFASGNGCSPGGGCVGGPIPIDPAVVLTTYKWNNWDAFNGSTQTNTSEVPSGISVYPQAVPTSTCTSSLGCPASFYYSTRPAWYSSSIPFPAIGPDVTGGNIGQCSGTLNASGKYAGLPGTAAAQCGSGNTLNTAWGGHVNAIPAQVCFLSLTNATLDGMGALSSNFDASVCYGSAPPPPTTFPLSVSKVGTGGGTVTSSPAEISCGSTCSASFNSGTPVALTAVPDGASSFTGWSGACSGTICNVTVNSSLSATATFTLIPPPPPGPAPTFSPGTGIYSSPVSITVSSTNPLIFYTRDGTTPRLTSTPYTSPISISSNTTLEAISAAGGQVRQNMQASLTGGGRKLCAPQLGGPGTPLATCTGGVGTAQPSDWLVSTDGTTMFYSVTSTSGAPQILVTLGGFGCDTCTTETQHFRIEPVANVHMENIEVDMWHNDGTHNRLHMFGLQCNQQVGKLNWQVDNEQGSWQNTGITDNCPMTAGVYTDVVLEGHWVIGDTGCGGLGCTVFDNLYINGVKHAINMSLENDNPGWSAGCANQKQLDLRPGGTVSVPFTASENIQQDDVTCAQGVSATSNAVYTFQTLNPLINFGGHIQLSGQIKVQ